MQDELERVKFRIEILNIIEDKLREMKALAQRVVENELEQEEIQRVQLRVNELAKEIGELEQINGVEVVH